MQGRNYCNFGTRQFITVTYNYTETEHRISRTKVKLSLIVILDSQNPVECKGRILKLCKMQFGQRNLVRENVLNIREFLCSLGTEYYRLKSLIFFFILLTITTQNVIVFKDQISPERDAEEGAKALRREKLPTFSGN